MRESYFVSNYINKVLDDTCHWYINTTIDNPKMAGFPDIMALHKSGKFVFIETKNETYLPKDHQIEWCNYLRGLGLESHIVFVDNVGRTKISDRKLKSRIEMGLTPFTEFKKMMYEL